MDFKNININFDRAKNISPIYYLLIAAIIGFAYYLYKNKDKISKQVGLNSDDDKILNGRKPPVWYTDEMRKSFEDNYYWHISNQSNGILADAELTRARLDYIAKYPTAGLTMTDNKMYAKALATDGVVDKFKLNYLQGQELQYYYGFGYYMENPISLINKPNWLAALPKLENDIWFYYNHFLVSAAERFNNYTKHFAFAKALDQLVHNGNAGLSENYASELKKLNPYKEGEKPEKLPKVEKFSLSKLMEYQEGLSEFQEEMAKINYDFEAMKDFDYAKVLRITQFHGLGNFNIGGSMGFNL